MEARTELMSIPVNTAGTIGGRVRDQRRDIPEVLEMTQDLWCHGASDAGLAYILKVLADLGREDPKFASPTTPLVRLFRCL